MEQNSFLQTINKTNRLMMNILWVATIAESLFLVFLTHLAPVYIITMISFLLLLTLTVTFLYIKKKAIDKIMYVAVIGCAMLNFMFVYLFHDPNGLITAYICILVIGLYQEYKIVIMEALLCAGSITYGFFSEGAAKMFGSFNTTGGFINILFSLSLFTYFMCSLCISSKRIKLDIIKEKEETQQSKGILEQVFTVMKESINTLTNVASRLEDDIKVLNHITNQVQAAFIDISAHTDKQTTVLSVVNDEVSTQSNSFNEVSKASKDMSELSSKNLEIINLSEENLDKLVGGIGDITDGTSNAALSINQLQEHTNNIGKVLETVNSISSQITLLALNASIEAARAGEHGRGFSVVALEVGKLADQSKQSTVEISDILGEIYKQVEQVSSQMSGIQSAVKAGELQANKVSEFFDIIIKNSDAVYNKAESVDEMAQKVQNFSKSYADKMQEVVGLFEETSTTIDLLMDSIEDQSGKVSQIVQSNNDVKDIIKRLSDTINK